MQPSTSPAIGAIEWRRAPRLEVTGQIQGQILGIDAPIIVRAISVDGFRIVTSVDIAVDAIHELRFTRQDGVEEAWRVMQPLLDSPPPVHAYAPGSWGPAEGAALVAGHGGWREPWI